MKLNFVFAALSLALGSTIPLTVHGQSAGRTLDDAGTMDKETADRVYSSKPIYSPYAGRKFPTRPLFGDTHLHTAASFDAGAFGARLGARDAYRFARGEEVIASSGQPAKLSRPPSFVRSTRSSVCKSGSANDWVKSSTPTTRPTWT